MPASGALYDVWATSASDVWVVGNNSTVLRYDGNSWSKMATGTTAPLYSITGTSASDLWASGYDLLRYANGAWSKFDWDPPARPFPWINDVWAASPSEAWAVSGYVDLEYPRAASSIHHFDGAKWSEAPFFDQTSSRSLIAVWGSSRSNVWVVGYEDVPQDGATWPGRIWHYNGTAWSRVPSPSSATLHAIWGRSSSDVWAVGSGGAIVHYDGSSWSNVPSGTTRDLHDVWGASPSSVWVVGEVGTILRYDGSSWLKMDSGTQQTLSAIWGTSASNVWVVGVNGTILHGVP